MADEVKLDVYKVGKEMYVVTPDEQVYAITGTADNPQVKKLNISADAVRSANYPKAELLVPRTALDTKTVLEVIVRELKRRYKRQPKTKFARTESAARPTVGPDAAFSGRVPPAPPPPGKKTPREKKAALAGRVPPAPPPPGKKTPRAKKAISGGRVPPQLPPPSDESKGGGMERPPAVRGERGIGVRPESPQGGGGSWIPSVRVQARPRFVPNGGGWPEAD